jgi:hypothetical protein
VSSGSSQRGPTRQVIATLLRWADADIRDARRLDEADSPGNAALLARNAATRLVEAAVASEHGYIATPDAQSIDDRNPLKRVLLRLDLLPHDPLRLQQNGRPAAAVSTASLQRSLRDLAEALDRLLAHFGVDRAGSGAAKTDQPLLPPPPPPRRQPKPRPGAAAPREKPPAEPEREPATNAEIVKFPMPPGANRKRTSVTRRSSSLTSGVFWSLVDRWRIGDLDALKLIGHSGGLTAKGTRPRFKLTEGEAGVVAAMQALDAALEQIGLDPARWLSTPLGPAPFGGGAPLDIIRKHRLQGVRVVGRYVTQMGLRISLTE